MGASRRWHPCFSRYRFGAIDRSLGIGLGLLFGKEALGLFGGELRVAKFAAKLADRTVEDKSSVAVRTLIRRSSCHVSPP